MKDGVRYWTDLEFIMDIMLSVFLCDPEEDNITEDKKRYGRCMISVESKYVGLVLQYYVR